MIERGRWILIGLIGGLTFLLVFTGATYAI